MLRRARAAGARPAAPSGRRRRRRRCRRTSRRRRPRRAASPSPRPRRPRPSRRRSARRRSRSPTRRGRSCQGFAGSSASGCQSPPAPPQDVGGALGPAVAGEDALLVAVDAHDAGRGRRSRRSSRRARRRRRRCGRRRGGSSRAARPGTPRSTAPAASACSPGMVSAPYSVMMIGLPCLPAQALQLGLQPALGGGQVAGVDVPAVVAVEHHARRRGRRRGTLPGGASIMLTKPTGPGRVELAGSASNSGSK